MAAPPPLRFPSCPTAHVGARRLDGSRPPRRQAAVAALFFTLVIGALALRSAADTAPAPKPSWSELHDQSLRLRDHHRFDDARAAALGALAAADILADPEARLACHVNLASIASLMRAWAEADKHLEQALLLADDSARDTDARIALLLMLGDARMQDHRPAAAEPAYAEAARLCQSPPTRFRPSLPPALFALGKIALFRGDHSLAADRFTACLSAAETPANTPRAVLDTRLEIAECYAERGRSADASRHFMAAMLAAEMSENVSLVVDVHKRRSVFHKKIGDHHAAWDDSAAIVLLWRDAAKRTPSPDAELQLAQALVDLSSLGLAAGQGEAAELACREALEITTRLGGEQSGEVASIELALADLLLDLDQLTEANRRFAAYFYRLERDTPANDARHLDADQSGFYLRYALLLEKTARPASAAVLHALGDSLAAHDTDDEARTLRSARAALSLLPGALAEPGGLPRLLRQRVPYLEWTGRVLLAQRRPAEAAEALREALASLDKSLPDHTARRARLEGDLATCLRVQERFDAALDLARRSVAGWSEVRPPLHRQISAARLVCAELLAALGRHDEAAAFHADTQRLQNEWDRSAAGR